MSAGQWGWLLVAVMLALFAGQIMAALSSSTTGPTYVLSRAG